MKIDGNILEKDKVSILKDAQKEYKMVGFQKRVAGHILFEFNTEINQLNRAKVNHEAILNMDGSVSNKARVNIKKGCVYVQAMNEKNAIKKLIKLANKNKQSC